jgi:hypothetical protein
MMRAVLPRASAREIWLLTGRTDAAPSSGGRAPPLDDETGGGDESDEEEELDDGEASLREGAAG